MWWEIFIMHIYQLYSVVKTQECDIRALKNLWNCFVITTFYSNKSWSVYCFPVKRPWHCSVDITVLFWKAFRLHFQLYVKCVSLMPFLTALKKVSSGCMFECHNISFEVFSKLCHRFIILCRYRCNVILQGI